MQKLYFGSHKNLKTIISGINFSKALLVCGKSFESLPIKDTIDSLGIKYVKFNEFKPNPAYEEVCRGVEVFKKEGCDIIIAVGGGSAIDVAKCIKLFAKMDEGKIFFEQEYKDTKIPFIAIPTTAGTGSESTKFAVIYRDGTKCSVSHDSLIPDCAVLDSCLLATLPEYQKKCTLLDAFCQAIEAWWSVNSTDESKEYSKKAIEMIMGNMDKYIYFQDAEAAENIMCASNFAGRAINITRTTAPHAMSYKLTSMYGLPHGRAVAICLPYVWQKMTERFDKCADSRGAEYLEGVFSDIAAALGCADAQEAIGKFNGILKKLDMKHSFTKEAMANIKVLADSVNVERLSNNPVRFDSADLQDIYERIVQE